MKKLSLILLTILCFGQALACDICGGGLGSNYLGLMPDFNNRFFGIRYHFNKLNTQLDIDGNTTALSNTEKYQTAELWGGYNLNNKWRLMAILPYGNIEKYNHGTANTQHKNGIGDISLSTFYNVWNADRTIQNKKIVQSLWIGTGIKLATGEYNSDVAITSNSPNIYQLGTGSHDIMTFVNYDIRLQDIGLNISSNYKINTENSDEYRYGNKFSTNVNIYHKILVSDQFRIAPNIGLSYENQAKDKNKGYVLDQTGGNNTNLNIGIESNIGKIALGANFQIPIKQDINNRRTELKQKLSTHLTYTF